MSEPDDLHAWLWREAVRQFNAGDRREVARLLRAGVSVPPDVASLLADVVEGRIETPKRRGPLGNLTTPRRFALRAKNAELVRQNVSEAARVDRLGHEFHLSATAVRDELRTPRGKRPRPKG